MSRRILLSLLLVAAACSDDDGTPSDASTDTRDGMVRVDGDLPDVSEDTGPAVCEAGSTLGNACTNDTQCSDACFCNGPEGCVGGTCVASTRAPCPEGVECAVSTCDEEMDSCDVVLDHASCSDGDACNGIEQCDVAFGGCRGGAEPYCNDEDSCTVDSCDPVTGCVFLPRDLDGDGFRDGRCGGDDCDDDPRFGSMIFPGAVEDCTNRRDDNCDGIRDYSDPGCMAMNDTCATAQVLPGPGTYSGATRGLRSTVTTCGSGADAFFSFTLTEPQDVQVNVAGGFGTSVAIRSEATCASGPDIRCNNGTPAAVLQRSLPAGDYIIVVKQSSGGIFDLTLRFSEPTEVPPVDQCNAATLDISAGGTFTGMYLEVEDDYRLSCGGTGRRDAAYVFTIEEGAPMDVALTATTSGGGGFSTTYISLVRDCDNSATTVQCITSSSFGTPRTLRQRGLAPGTYYVLVESSDTSAAGWSLVAEFTEPGVREPGDACTTAIDINPIGAATTGMGSASLTRAERDTPPSCGSTSSTAKDVYFTFDVTEPGGRDVTITTEGAGFHYTGVSTVCGDSGTELRCRNGSSPLTQLFRSVPMGTYFIAVSTTLSSGTVTARASFAAPTPVPPNDRCSGAIDISAGGVYTGTLTDFEDDARGCSGTGRPDAFYTFTLPSRKVVSIVGTRLSGSGSLVLTLRAACSDSSPNLSCDTGSPAVANVTLDAGTYFLYVESTGTTLEDFRLTTSFFDE